MSVWIDRILVFALIVVVVALAVTSVPALRGETLGGQALMGHMMSSGLLVFGLPIFALVFLRHLSASRSTSIWQKLGYLAVITTGLLTILTVFLCMLPIPSTREMHTLMSVHRWAGLAMIPTIALLVIGMLATRSASHRHS